jgi:hypothetical protein
MQFVADELQMQLRDYSIAANLKTMGFLIIDPSILALSA